MNRSTIQDSYVEVKLKLIKLAVEASKNITTFSLLEEMTDLQGQFCYSDSELLRYNNDILVLKCYLLQKKLAEHINDLADYGITERKLAQLEQTIEDFKIISAQHTSFLQEIIPENIIPIGVAVGN
jgi:hypothetical protein